MFRTTEDNDLLARVVSIIVNAKDEKRNWNYGLKIRKEY